MSWIPKPKSIVQQAIFIAAGTILAVVIMKYIPGLKDEKPDDAGGML